MKFEDDNNLGRKDQHGSGNSSVLAKVDKLRELVGTGVSLPQLVVVGDQSSGKSSVLENLTGFAFPRDAELCTRYATQITCRRDAMESIAVSIIASPNASEEERSRVQAFHSRCTDLSPANLAQIFREANEKMGISSGSKKFDAFGMPLPAFSEHMLRIEKLGPEEEHFTVIDVPGIFRRETEGVTTEQDIILVRNMVEKYIKDSRTIILAIIPSNVDPATQEILKLAKIADPEMTRTMAVLTKPDLAIELTTQNIAIDHVLGKRGNLTLGYYVVKNRGPDPGDAEKTLEQAQADERIFFSKGAWSKLLHTGKAGIACLKKRVRELLDDITKKEFPKLKVEFAEKLSSIRECHDLLGVSRADQHSQRMYLNSMSEMFQSLTRDALNAYYVGNTVFSDRHELRLITRVVEAGEKYANEMLTNGHTRPFLESDEDAKKREAGEFENEAENIGLFNHISRRQAFKGRNLDYNFETAIHSYPELEAILHSQNTFTQDTVDGDINDYIDGVYQSSRGQDLGNLGNGLLATLFKEQSRKWEDITLEHISAIIFHVHRFISEVMTLICPDKRVLEDLWNDYLLEPLMASYRKAMDHAKFLLKIEREGHPLTLNHSLNRQGGSLRADKLIQEVKNTGCQNQPGNPQYTVTSSQLEKLRSNRISVDQVHEQMHDLLLSYYEIARSRFVDVIYQQAINHYLLFGEGSPLKVFATKMVMSLNDDQLEMIAAEDAVVKEQRERLVRDMSTYNQALDVLRGR